jgi:hypothetical protein
MFNAKALVYKRAFTEFYVTGVKYNMEKSNEWIPCL